MAAGSAPTRRATDPAWQAIEARRVRLDGVYVDRLTPHLDRQRLYYRRRALSFLTQAATGTRAVRETTYGTIDMEALLGDIQAAVDAYVEAMAPAWGESWTEAMLYALDEPAYVNVGVLDIAPADYEPLVVDSRPMVDYDRKAVTETVLAGMDQGLSPQEIARQIDELENFGTVRALRVARTENVRSQESGYGRRIDRAAAMGVPIIGHGWLSDPLAAMFDRRHDLMHRKTVALGGRFVLPSGVETEGPGLSGVPGEDINCRCARYAVVAKGR